jgi:hypothetical protein
VIAFQLPVKQSFIAKEAGISLVIGS